MSTMGVGSVSRILHPGVKLPVSKPPFCIAGAEQGVLVGVLVGGTVGVEVAVGGVPVSVGVGLAYGCTSSQLADTGPQL